MLKKLAGTAAAAIVLAGMLTGCGTDPDVQKCIDQVEQTLKEAGSDRALTQDEKDACNDPQQRAFILGE